MSGSIGSPESSPGRADARVRIARELVRAIRDRTRRALGLEREIGTLVADQAPELLELPGCGTLTAAKIVAETAASSASAPTPSSPGSPASPRSPPPRATDSATASTAAATASSTAPCTGSRSPRVAFTHRLGTSSPASRPRASRGWRRLAASSATSPEPSGRLFAPPATESRSTPSPLLIKLPICGQPRGWP